ncbi:unnamed protein product [Blepharisma stoltei]|uniref:Uncharacterized protein n=1 Tax=Blepharisma stoltei TaxID=1481888 RepID=A0AAU9KKD1_9CILI|nr:unnamed protein product [Blepharisma stoltei]
MRKAPFFIGLFLGAYTGAIFREEYYFPTSERIKHAIAVFRKNQEAIIEATKLPNPGQNPEPIVEKKEEQKK